MVIVKQLRRNCTTNIFTVMVTFSGIVAGCAHQASLSPARTDSAHVAILYSTYGEPITLNDGQLSEITRLASEASPHRKIWFIFVRYHQADSTGRHYRAVVYFVPDQKSERLRKGQCTYVDNDVSEADRRWMAQHLGSTWPYLQSYVQVSAAPAPFGVGLATPELGILPFLQPSGMSESDLVGVVDSARDFRSSSGEKQHEPILRIEVEKGNYQIMFGSLAGPLDGAGKMLNLRRIGSRYQLVDVISNWVS